MAGNANAKVGDSKLRPEDSSFTGPYRLSVLGRVEVVGIRGELVTVPRGKPLAVLVYLAFHEGGVGRDELAHLLWGEKELSKGRQSVRQVLLQLRKYLGAEAFFSDDPVRLAPGVVRMDFEEFREAVEGGDLDAGLELWRGEPLSGLSVSEASWTQWSVELGSSAKRILVTGLEERALEAVGAGRFDDAVAELKRAAALVPDRVETWAHLVEIQIDFGRVREARTSLADAWRHVEPDAYEERLGPLERRLSMGPDAAILDADGGIIARESDVAAISAAWRLAGEERTEVLFFEGAEGYGKSRLLEEAAEPIVSPGARIIRAPTQGSGSWVAAAGWMRGLGAMKGADGVTPQTADVLASFLDLPGGDIFGPPIPPSSEGALADAFFDLLSSVALREPTLLLIDNAEFIDPDSWQLLRRLVRLRPSFPLLVCLAWDSSESDEELRRDVVDWVGKGWVGLRRLRPFTQDEVNSLIRLRGWKHDGAIEEAGRQVFDRSKGHPELVFGFLRVLEENRLRPSPLSDRPPSIPDLMTLPLSEPLEDFYRKKLDDLPDRAHRLVRVLGNTSYATIHTLEYNTGLGSPELLSLISDLVARGIVEMKDEGVGLVNMAFATLAREIPEDPLQYVPKLDDPELFYTFPEEPGMENSVLAALGSQRALINGVGITVVLAIVIAIVWALFLR